jgi:hypothetical protein
MRAKCTDIITLGHVEAHHEDMQKLGDLNIRYSQKRNLIRSSSSSSSSIII